MWLSKWPTETTPLTRFGKKSFFCITKISSQLFVTFKKLIILKYVKWCWIFFPSLLLRVCLITTVLHERPQLLPIVFTCRGKNKVSEKSFLRKFSFNRNWVCQCLLCCPDLFHLFEIHKSWIWISLRYLPGSGITPFLNAAALGVINVDLSFVWCKMICCTYDLLFAKRKRRHLWILSYIRCGLSSLSQK